MTKTSLEVTTEALRMIGVVADDEDATAGQYARAKLHMESIFGYLNNTLGLAFEWTIETVPDDVYLPFSEAVAGSVAPSEGLPEYMPLKAQGIRGIKEFAAPNMIHENHVTRANYF